MRKTSSQSQWFLFLGTQASKTIVGCKTVTLERAVKIYRDELLEAGCRSSGMPIKNNVSSGLTHDPQIALSTLSVSRIKDLIGVSSTWMYLPFMIADLICW